MVEAALEAYNTSSCVTLEMIAATSICAVLHGESKGVIDKKELGMSIVSALSSEEQFTPPTNNIFYLVLKRHKLYTILTLIYH